MAKKPAFVTRTTAAKRRPFSHATFIQRSRGESSEQKAMWHNVTGAGRSGVIRTFFDLSREEQEACRDLLQTQLETRLRSLSR